MNTKLYVFLLIFISFQAQAKRAVIIIDPQDAFIVRSGNIMMRQNQEKALQMRNNIIELMRRAHEAQLPVYVVGYGGYGPIHPLIQRELSYNPQGFLFWKWTDGAFDSGTPIREYLLGELQLRGIDEILLAGANGGACVKATVLGALHLPLELKVTAITPAIADYNLNPFVFPYRFDQYMKKFPAFSQLQELPDVDWLANSEIDSSSTLHKTGEVDLKRRACSSLFMPPENSSFND